MRTTLKAAIATIGCMCAVGMVCVAATDAKTGKRKSTPEEIAERKARFIQRTGGFVRKPGSGSGKVAIINSQNRFSNEDLKPVAIAVDKLMRLDCAVVRAENVGLSEAGKAVKSTGAAAGVVVAALEASLPPLILFPDQMCAVVNVGAFPKNANAVLLRKEVVRGLTAVSGAMESQVTPSLMRAFPDIRDLNTFQAEWIPADVMVRMKKCLMNVGVAPYVIKTYKQACREGWANAPTNDLQKAVMESVKSEKERGPVNAIEIPMPSNKK